MAYRIWHAFKDERELATALTLAEMHLMPLVRALDASLYERTGGPRQASSAVALLLVAEAARAGKPLKVMKDAVEATYNATLCVEDDGDDGEGDDNEGPDPFMQTVRHHVPTRRLI